MSLPGAGHASRPGLDVSALVNNARVAQLESVTPVARSGTPRASQSTLRSASDPNATPPAPTIQLGGAADPTDPYIMAQAQALNNDPSQIFAFVRDHISYEAYKGSLRGARGALWSKAGNALDRASLLVALLRASGFTAQYVQGTLPDALATQLVLSMFSPALALIGCIPPATPLADPASDATLLALAREHYWVEFNHGGSAFIEADPAFASAQLGQTFGVPSGTFADVPAALQHTATVTLTEETFSQIAADFGLNGGISTTTVLTQTFTTAGLVGVPLTFGNLVSVASTNALVISEKTITYSPYVIAGTGSTDISQDTVVRGTDYQEVFTNLPLASQVLTGLFLTIAITDANGNTQEFQKTLFDRIGFASRQGGGTASVSVTPSSAPSISDTDLTTANVLPALQDPGQVLAYRDLAASIQNQGLVLQPAVLQLPKSGLTAAQNATLQQAKDLAREFAVVSQRFETALLALLSDASTTQLATAYYVKAYFDTPRLLVATSRAKPGGLSLELDLLKDDIRVLAPPQQSTKAALPFNVTRGLQESYDERAIFRSLASTPPPGGITVSLPVNLVDVFNTAQATGTGFALITSANLADLNTLAFSPEALARITAAAGAGRWIVTPRAPVMINNAPAIGWLETDPSTGFTTSVGEDGSHQALIEYGAVLEEEGAEEVVEYNAFEFMMGFGMGILYEDVIQLALTSVKTQTNEFGVEALNTIADLEASFINEVLLEEVSPSFIAGFEYGMFEAGKFVRGYEKQLGYDPPVPTLLLAPKASATPPAPGSTPGVTADIVSDSPWAIPLGGALVPLVFRAVIQNTGPQQDVFDLSFPDPPPGFSLQSSVSSVVVPAGAIAQVGVCLVPTGAIGAPGTPESFEVSATSATDPAVSATATFPFSIPSFPGLTLAPSPPVLSSTPATPVNATLVIHAVGNAPVSATLTALSDPNLSVSGLSGSASIAPGATVVQNLTLTPSANAPLGSSLGVRFRATFGPPDALQTVDTSLSVEVIPLSAKPALDGVVAANALGRTDIGQTLFGLSGAIATLAGNCADATKTVVLSYLDNLTREMNAPFLANFTLDLGTARSEVAAASCSDISTALDDLGAALSNLDTVLSSPVAFPFDLSLAPNIALALPRQPATFKVLLQNNSTATNTYDLSLGSLPAGISGGLNVSSITLAPGANTLAMSAGNPVVTLTESASSVIPAQFTLTASIEGLSGSARSTTGALTVQNEFLAVTSVNANPGIVNPGDSTDVTAQLANVVNEPRTVNVSLAVKDPVGTLVLTPPGQSVQLSVQSLLTTVDFGQINTQGLADGDYTLLVTVTDPDTGQPLPGGTGTGTLLVGLPVSATLSVSPAVLPPGNGTVTTTLTVTGPGSDITGSPFLPLGNVATASPGESLALDGALAYVCDDNEISVTDVTDPAHPVLLGTAASTSLKNDGLVHCSIRSGKLVAFADANSSLVGNNPVFLYFDLSNATQPSFVHATSISKRFFAEPVYIGNTAFVPTTAVFFFPGDGIIDQRGDLVAVDLTDFNNPLVVGTLEQNQPNFDATFGGHHPVFGAAMLDSQTLLVGTTSASGGGATLNTGVGQLLAVDVSNPAAMSTVKTVDVPGTVHLYKPIIQGNLAIAIGAAGGYHVPCCAPDNGPVVVATFDITDPRNPVLLTTLTTTLNPANGGGLAAIGNNLFLFAGIQNSTNQLVLLEVDTTDPGNPAIQTFSIPTQVNRMVPVGTVLYTVGPNGLTTYSIPGVSGTQYSATVQIDNNGTAAYDPTSFSVAPTSITSGTGADTVKWLNPGNNTITWRSNVTGIEPGQVVPVAEGGTVSFKTALGSGAITLAQVPVTSDQILGLNPAAQTVEPAQLAPYVVTVKNPMAAPVTYALAVEGVSMGWATLQSSVTVPASGQTSVPLDLRSELGAAAGSYSFVVTASAPGGAQGSVEGTLTLQGTANIGQTVSTTARGVSVTLVPPQGTAGQGTTTTFGVQITNAGNATDTYNLSASLPPGVGGVFDQTSVQVPPGLSNLRQVNLHLTPSPGTAPGNQGFTVTAVSATDSGVQDQASGTLTIAASGVSVGLTPPSAGPGSTFQMTVTNTGHAPDTFDLSVGGPAAAVASLGSTAVTLGPGASRVVPITVGAIAFADPGSLTLTAVATSRASTAVKASATAAVSIGATTGMTAEFSPATVNLPSPGAATLLLLVHNTGNTEDAYTSVIAGTAGPISAALTGLDGQPTQTIPTFRLPGLSTGAIALNANLSAPGQGTVTVRVTSLTNGVITSAPSAVVQTASGTATLTTQASTNATNVAPGTSVSDTATVSPLGAGPTPTGTVTFFLCSPSQVTSAGCPAPAGTQVGAAKTLGASGVTTSDATTGTSVPGRYCWRAEYSGDGQYAGVSHNDASQECFTVVGPTLKIQKTPKGGPYALGNTITFAIVVTNNGPGAATAVTLDDLLPGEPADLNWSVSQPPAQGSCTVNGAQGNQTLHCTLGDLAEKGSVTVAVASATGVTDAADCLPAPGIANVRPAVSGPGTGALGAVACASNAANAASGTTPAGCVADTASLLCGCPDANPLLGIAGACAVLQGGSNARHPFQLQISGPPGGVEGNLCVGPGSQLHASGTSPVIDGTVLLDGGGDSLPAATCKSSNPNISCPAGTSDLSAQIQACAIAASNAVVEPCTMGTDYSQSLTALASGPRNNLTISGSGDEVLCVSDVTLTGQASLELTGLPGTTFLINVKAGGTFSVSGKSKIKVDGTNVTADHVLYNVMGAGHSVQLTGQSEIDGSVIATDRDVQLSAPSVVIGTVCGGQDIQLTGGIKICPQ